MTRHAPRLEPRRLAAAPPRTILVWVLVIIVAAIGATAVAPWILPVRIIEGPMVQLASQDSVALVWYTTRPADCTLTVTVAGEDRACPVSTHERRHLAVIDGLEPGTRYAYRISAGRRKLTDSLTLHTSRRPGKSFDFFVLGDSGTGTREQYALAADMTRYRPAADFIVHTGDLVYSDGARRKYHERFFSPYRHMLPRVNFWPCLGNHDVDKNGHAEPYQEVFELPDNGPDGLPADFNYWFDYASSRFVVIDTNAGEGILRERVAPWLLEVLADPAPRWRFAVFHHPPYTGGKYAPDERVQRALVPAIEQASVDVVFSGHDHTYQRTHPLHAGEIVPADQGVVYVISAAGGASLYEPKGPLPPYVAVLDHTHYSFTHVTIDGDTLKLRQVTLGGEILDEHMLQKELPPPAATEDAAPDDQTPRTPATRPGES